MWTEPPTDPRLNDGWCWQPVRAFPLLSPGASVRWSSVENLAGLPEVKSLTSELSTAAESVLSRRSMGVVTRLSWSEPAGCQNYKAENCTDVTVLVHKEHMLAVSSCRAQEEIYMDQIAVPTMDKSGLQMEAEKLSQDISGSVAPGVEIQCRTSSYLLVLVN